MNSMQTIVFFPLFFPCSMDAHLYRVAVGEYNLYEDDGSELFLRVESIIVHPDWTGDLGKG